MESHLRCFSYFNFYTSKLSTSVMYLFEMISNLMKSFKKRDPKDQINVWPYRLSCIKKYRKSINSCVLSQFSSKHISFVSNSCRLLKIARRKTRQKHYYFVCSLFFMTQIRIALLIMRRLSYIEKIDENTRKKYNA